MKTVVITGGSQGIGRALAEVFYADGYQVIAAARSADRLAEVAKALPGTLTFATDLSLKTGCDALGAYVLEKTGPPDVLINNAGTFLPGQILTEEPGTLEKLLATNVHSAYHTTRSLLPAMVAAGRGHVVNMCSTASIMAYANGGSYCISKFALLGFSRVLREELKATSLRVTAVLPGATLTPSWAGVDLPASRFIDPGELASLILHVVAAKAGTVVEELLVRPQLGDL